MTPGVVRSTTRTITYPEVLIILVRSTAPLATLMGALFTTVEKGSPITKVRYSETLSSVHTLYVVIAL